jgi:hypothetical protein
MRSGPATGNYVFSIAASTTLQQRQFDGKPIAGNRASAPGERTSFRWRADTSVVMVKADGRPRITFRRGWGKAVPE